jgi:diguanylate cyclase (GGDEF)-like protein
MVPSAASKGLPGRLKPRARGRRNAWAATTAILVLAGMSASLFAAHEVARSNADDARLAFHLASAQIASTLKLAIQHEEDLVASAGAFIANNRRPTNAGFIKWAASVHALERYPELQRFGLVVQVPASGLAAFEARIKAHPVTPGNGPFQLFPLGERPYYCFGVAGLERPGVNPVKVPPGVDYCSVYPVLTAVRDSGLNTYLPFREGTTESLAVETPLYRGGTLPSTAAARRAAFVGWLGETLTPAVLLDAALQGHPRMAVVLRYDLNSSHPAIGGGSAPAGGETTNIDLQNGWSVQARGVAVPAGIFSNLAALALLIGGGLLSVVLGLLVWTLATGRTRALSLVREKTRELARKNDELSHQALHDTLTGLPNRALVLDRAERLLARTARLPETTAAALFIDVDNFKHVNDNLGHAAGDELLKVVSARLLSTARDQDTVGRLGGDEFVVLVESTTARETIALVADRLIEALRLPVELEGGHNISSMSASIGGAVGRYGSPDELLRDADLALYAAKAAGKDRFVMFEPDMYVATDRRMEFQADLSAALRKEEFFLLYQPICRLPRRSASRR